MLESCLTITGKVILTPCLACCREHIGVHPCDRRFSISSKKAMFPAVDFSQIASEEDPVWTIDRRETKGEIMARGRAFMQQVMQRPEHSIAVSCAWGRGAMGGRKCCRVVVISSGAKWEKCMDGSDMSQKQGIVILHGEELCHDLQGWILK